MSVPSKEANSWLDSIAALLSKEPKGAPTHFSRRLAAERLEQRNVLSATTVAAPIDAANASYPPEFADYFKALGPVAPSATSQTAQIPTTQTQSLACAGAVPAAPAADYLFGTHQGEGRGEGEGSGSGTSGGAAASGSGAGAATGSGSGAVSGSGSGSGVGSGSGSGGGSGSGSTAGQAPVITDTSMQLDANGLFAATGTISDNDGLADLTFNLEGATGTITVDEYGAFNIQILDTYGNTGFTFTVTDAFGNTTTYTFQYPT